jgi:hypothetical protein
MKYEYICESANYSDRFNFKLAELSLMLGQREMLAKEILQKKWDSFKNPNEYKELLYDAYNNINERIKMFLYIE